MNSATLTAILMLCSTGDPAIGGVASTPCYYNGRVFVGSANGYLYCLDVATGAQVWARGTTDRSTPTAGNSRIISSPVVHDGIVYVGNEASKMYAFDTAGTLQQGYPVVLPIDDSLRSSWRRITSLATQNMTGTSSPAIATVDDVDYLLFGCDDGYIYRITLGVSDPQSTLVWEDLSYCVESSPTVVGDRAYVGVSHYYGTQVYRLSVAPSLLVVTGIDAKYPDVGPECRATFAYDGKEHLYAGLDTGYTFHKLAFDTLGNAVSPFTVGDYFVGSAAICGNGLLYVGNDDGAFRALTLSGLSQEAAYNAGSDFICSSPAIAYNVDTNHNRWVYITTRDGNGRLLAFKTER